MPCLGELLGSVKGRGTRNQAPESLGSDNMIPKSNRFRRRFSVVSVMYRNNWMGSVLLLTLVILIGIGLAAWKYELIQNQQAASANQPEPMESVTI